LRVVPAASLGHPEAPPPPPWAEAAKAALKALVEERIGAAEAKSMPRGALASRVSEAIKEWLAEKEIEPDPLLERDLITYLSNHLLGEASPSPAAIPVPHHQPADVAGAPAETDPIEDAKDRIQPKLLSRIDVSAASALPRAELAREIGEVVAEIAAEEKIQRNVVTKLVNDMVGLAARALAGRRGHHRYHGQRAEPDLHRAGRQARAQQD